MARIKITASTIGGPAALVLVKTFGLSPSDIRRLVKAGRPIPIDLDSGAATRTLEALRAQKCQAELIDVPPSRGRCDSHPTLATDASCRDCQRAICTLCAVAHRDPLCRSCAAQRRRSALFRSARIAVLLVGLIATGLWATRTMWRRDARTRWERQLTIAVVLLAPNGAGEVETEPWEDGAARLNEWFAREAKRYGLPLVAPVNFLLAGPVAVPEAPNFLPPDESLLSRAQHAWALNDTLMQLNRAAKGMPPRVDATIYVYLRSAVDANAPRFIEGVGERGGSHGLVHSTINDHDIGLDLIAVAHETLHCLGAGDAYDVEGHAVFPAGFVEPERSPRYPQPRAEVMVGEVPLSETAGKTAQSLDEVGIGPTTARLIRWPVKRRE